LCLLVSTTIQPNYSISARANAAIEMTAQVEENQLGASHLIRQWVKKRNTTHTTNSAGESDITVGGNAKQQNIDQKDK